MAEGPVAGEPGEPLDGMQPGEDNLDAAARFHAEPLEPPGLRAVRCVGLEEAVAFVHQEQESAPGVDVQPSFEAGAHPLVWVRRLRAATLRRSEYLQAAQLLVQHTPDGLRAERRALSDVVVVQVEVDLLVTAGLLLGEAVAG